MKKLLLFISSVLFSISLCSQVSIISQTNPPCPGMCNGAVTLSITGGIMPYTISNVSSSSCTTAPIPPFSSSTITISGLCPCIYNFVVTDATFNVIGGQMVTITSPPPITAGFSVTNVCCNGQCNGAISGFVFGGTPPYSYTWSPTGPSTPSLTGACAGTYTLCVMDGNGCSQCFTTQVTQPPVFSLSSSVAATSCSSCCDGQINASGSGGQPNYSYTLYPGSVTNTTGIFPNVCAGMYSVCASDAGCCFTCIGVTVPTGSVTSINNISSQSLSIDIVPNPSDGHIKLLSSQNLSALNYEIFDIIGNKIDFGKVADNINISQSADGVYILIIRNKESEIVSRRKLNIKH